MDLEPDRQGPAQPGQNAFNGRVGDERLIPNPKLKLMDQVREVLRVRHYSIRTERCYCDWIRRYVQYHRMRSREELFPGGGKVEEYLSDLRRQTSLTLNGPRPHVG